VALGGGQVHEPALADDIDAPAVLERVLHDELADLARRGGHLAEGSHLELDIEVAGVADDGAVLHGEEVLAPNHRAAAGDGDEHVADPGGLGDGHHAVAVHHGLEPTQRVDLAHGHMGAHALGPAGAPSAAHAVSAHDYVHACQQDVRRAEDAVDGALAGAVAVIEQVLRVGVVHRDDRVLQCTISLHGAQADDPGGRLLGAGDDALEPRAALLVEGRDDIGAVVHGQGWAEGKRGLDVGVVRIPVLAADREGRDTEVGHERCGDVILRRERIRGAQPHLGSPGHQGPHQVRGLGGHVEAGGELGARQGLLAFEPLADEAQHGHAHLGPLDAELPLAGEREIGDMVVDHTGLHPLSGGGERPPSVRRQYR